MGQKTRYFINEYVYMAKEKCSTLLISEQLKLEPHSISTETNNKKSHISELSRAWSDQKCQPLW